MQQSQSTRLLVDRAKELVGSLVFYVRKEEVVVGWMMVGTLT